MSYAVTVKLKEGEEFDGRGWRKGCVVVVPGYVSWFSKWSSKIYAKVSTARGGVGIEKRMQKRDRRRSRGLLRFRGKLWG